MPQTLDDLNALGAYLARRDLETLNGANFDLIVLVGSAILATAETAALAWRAGVSRQILICGGIGHSTSLLYGAVRSDARLRDIDTDGRTEAAILKDVLVAHYEVDPQAILLEDASTNCGENAWYTRSTLERQNSLTGERLPGSLLIIQDPTMQRRTHASFERAWRGVPAPSFISFAPFVPKVSAEGGENTEYVVAPWGFQRYLTLVLGEIPRLRDDANGYGPNGKDFIEHVDIPEPIERAFDRLTRLYENAVRPAMQAGGPPS